MNTNQPLTTEEFKILAVTMIFAVCSLLGVDIHLASLPHIMSYLQTDQSHIQQSISLFLLGIGCSLIFYGPLSDQYGRKPIVIFGLSFAAISSFAAAFANDINTFLVLRLFQGIGSGVCLGMGRTITADILQGIRLATLGSYFAMFLSLSPLIAPTVGGYIQDWFSWQANFIALGSILSIALILYIIFCPETNKSKNPKAFSAKGFYENYKTLLGHKLFMSSTLLTGLMMAANMAYATTSPFIFQVLFSLGPIAYGWVTAIAGAGNLIGKFTVPISIGQIGTKKTLRNGLILVFLAGFWIISLIFLKKITVTFIMIAVFFSIFGQSFIYPIAASTALSPFSDNKGAAAALYGSFQMLTAFLSSALIAGLKINNILLLGLTYCSLGFLGLCLYQYWAHKGGFHHLN